MVISVVVLGVLCCTAFFASMIFAALNIHRIMKSAQPELVVVMAVVIGFCFFGVERIFELFLFAQQVKEVSLEDNDKGSVATLIPPSKITTRLDDIAGMNEAKKEVSEIIEFLKNPEPYRRLGAKPPKGVIIYGPPGTGKTMMARAIAGEAHVPFISVAGSAFDEVYVGKGAARVRELFKVARENKPCIIFIDEIDALARARDRSGKSGNDQTVNQFLAELDNIDTELNEGIIVLAATNRLDSLDSAVLRPGRFDRKVYFRLPNLKERQEILELLVKKIQVAKGVQLDKMAQITAGFSGADLANLVNEAAIDATRKKKSAVDMASFEEANDKIVLGTDLGSGSYTEKEKRLTAYHEAGHALVGLLHPDHPARFHKMTIGLRGDTLGVTRFRFENEELSTTKAQYEAIIAGALGGYVAEEIVFGKSNVTSGASSDLQAANNLARAMVTRFAMADDRSLLVDDIIPQGFDFVTSNATRILERDFARASQIINSNRAKLDLLANALLEKETLDHTEVAKLLGLEPRVTR